jgi:hypothetical protein
VKKIITAVTISVLLISCGGGGDSDKDGDNNNTNDTTENSSTDDSTNDNSNSDQNTDTASVLSGYTWRSCTPFTSTSAGYTYTFTENEFVSTYDTYGDNSCSGDSETSIEHSAGNYLLGESVITSGGFEAVEIDFYVTSISGTPVPETIQETLHDIFYIENDVLYFGDDRSINEGERTDTIDTSVAYLQNQE